MKKTLILTQIKDILYSCVMTPKFPSHLKGFTLIELLVVMGILLTLFSIVLITINPFEHINRSNDIAAKSVSRDIETAMAMYLLENRLTPWEKNGDCANELDEGGLLSEMDNCISELTKGGDIHSKYLSNAGLSDMEIGRCGSSAIICYDPKSKTESSNLETKYTKLGVNDPGCPGNGSGECYWCRPLIRTSDCNIVQTPTPSITITPTPPSFPNLIPGYQNGQTKLFKTYAVFLFDYPGFPPPPGGWSIHFSTRSDFGGDYTETHRSFAVGTNYSHTIQNASYTAYHLITDKYAAFQSLAGQYPLYNSNCGKTIYWRVANYYNESEPNKLVGPTYTDVVDCATQAGVIDPPLSWYSVFDMLSGTQKHYDTSWDFDNSGEIDWIDYWLGAFSTKTRYGGWQPPE